MRWAALLNGGLCGEAAGWRRCTSEDLYSDYCVIYNAFLPAHVSKLQLKGMTKKVLRNGDVPIQIQIAS